MIEVDIIKRKRSGDTAVNGGVQNGTTVVGGNGEAQHAINADEAAHAQRADESAHASSAKELDGGSSVWNTIRAWIANANESLKDVFLRKDKDDETAYTLTMGGSKVKGNADFGDFTQGILTGTGGRVDSKGNAEFESIRSRSSIEALELIVNRLAALEGDQVFTETDTIDTVDNIGDGTYGLHLKRKWDGYFTAIKEGSVLRAIMNTLAKGSGTYYTAWFRVNSVNTANNYIEVSMYADSDTPAGKNYPPCSLMKISRWGHQTDTALQSCFYLSSNEGRIVHLVNVTKPIIGKENYGSVIGTLPEFVKSITDENGNPLPLIDGIDYLYAPGIVTRDIIRINKWTMKREPNYVDEGQFVQGGKYYCEATNPDTGVYETSDVWYYGCKWRCCKNLTTTAPAWNNTDWAMIEGNPNFTAEFEEGTDQVVDPENINIPLHLVCTLYNQDVTKDIKDTDVAWTRYSEDADGNERAASDNLWAVNHANSGKGIVLTEADMDFNGYIPKSIKFMATATLRDGMTATATYEK